MPTRTNPWGAYSLYDRTPAHRYPPPLAAGRGSGYDFEGTPGPRSEALVTLPYAEVFLALLLAYMVYSVWARIDGRLPIAAALGLLVVTAVVDGL